MAAWCVPGTAACPAVVSASTHPCAVTHYPRRSPALNSHVEPLRSGPAQMMSWGRASGGQVRCSRRSSGGVNSAAPAPQKEERASWRAFLSMQGSECMSAAAQMRLPPRPPASRCIRPAGEAYSRCASKREAHHPTCSRGSAPLQCDSEGSGARSATSIRSSRGRPRPGPTATADPPTDPPSAGMQKAASSMSLLQPCRQGSFSSTLLAYLHGQRAGKEGAGGTSKGRRQPGGSRRLGTLLSPALPSLPASPQRAADSWAHTGCSNRMLRGQICGLLSTEAPPAFLAAGRHTGGRPGRDGPASAQGRPRPWASHHAAKQHTEGARQRCSRPAGAACRASA